MKALKPAGILILITISALFTGACGSETKTKPAGAVSAMQTSEAVSARTIDNKVVFSTAVGDFRIEKVVFTPSPNNISAATLEVAVRPEDGNASTTDRLRSKTALDSEVILSASDGTTRNAVDITFVDDEITFKFDVNAYLDNYQLLWPYVDPMELDPLITQGNS